MLRATNTAEYVNRCTLDMAVPPIAERQFRCDTKPTEPPASETLRPGICTGIAGETDPECSLFLQARNDAGGRRNRSVSNKSLYNGTIWSSRELFRPFGWNLHTPGLRDGSTIRHCAWTSASFIRRLEMYRSGRTELAIAAVALAFVATLSAQGRQGEPGGAQGGRGGRGNVQLPDGDGRDTVNATCGGCHGLNMITGAAGYTQDGWRDLISTMVRLPEPQQASITQYLAAHFPPKPGRAPKLIPGDVTVTFREWIVPTLGQRSRDPLQRPDGTIWWNGQFISLVGSLDPRTSEMREYKLETDAHPHSIVDDADGNIWYMGNGNGTIGKLVPKTGEITVFKMPDPAARDPHTGIFDKNGTLFFTLQQSNMIGRLTPSTGEIKLITLPTPRAASLRHQAGFERHHLGVLQRVEQAREPGSPDDGSA